MTGKIALLLGVLAVSAFAQVQGERLIWSDEFDTYDEKKWGALVSGWDGGNGEFQYYRNNRKNSYARDSILYVLPTPTVDEIADLEHGKIEEPGCNMEPCVVTGGKDIINPYFSARLTTKQSFSFKYGRVEFLARVPTGDWLWPAVWLMPTKDVYGPWPQSGEIDMLEAHGNPDIRSPDGVNRGNVLVESTLHFGPSRNVAAALNKQRQAPGNKTWADGMHKYEFIWTPDQMKFLVDGLMINEINIPEGGFAELGRFDNNIWKGKGKDAPFNQEFYLIINVAIGGSYFPEDWKSGGRPRPWTKGDNRRQFWKARNTWQNTWGKGETAALQLDYIRVYQN